MIIRSQDEKVIVNLNNIDSICIEHNVCKFDVACKNGFKDTRVGIGAYSTEEKAIKVLDMIQNEFQSEIRKHRVFQMPQDSEV